MVFDTTQLWGYIYIVLGALAFAFIPGVSRISNWFTTIVHETGHGLMSIILPGIKLGSFRLHNNGSGETGSFHAYNPFSRLSRIIELFAGYSFPIYLGISLIVSATLFDNTKFGIIALAGMGVLMLLYIRNWFGIVILVVYFAFLFAWYAMAGHVLNSHYVIIFMGATFLIRGICDIITAAKLVYGDYPEAVTDFHLLQEAAFFPAKAWFVIYILIQIVIITLFFVNLPIDISIV